MAQYNEKAKERIMRYQKKAYSPLNLNLRKGVKEKYKAFAASRGVSLTELITQLIEYEIEKAGFEYAPEEEKPGE